MNNVNEPQFNYELFKKLYDEDPKLQTLIGDFNNKKIIIKQDSTDELKTTEPSSNNTLSSMAKHAVDLSDN